MASWESVGSRLLERLRWTETLTLIRLLGERRRRRRLLLLLLLSGWTVESLRLARSSELRRNLLTLAWELSWELSWELLRCRLGSESEREEGLLLLLPRISRRLSWER